MLKLYEAQKRDGAPTGLPEVSVLWHNSWRQYSPTPAAGQGHSPPWPGCSYGSVESAAPNCWTTAMGSCKHVVLTREIR
jgi:hypothetical protein